MDPEQDRGISMSGWVADVDADRRPYADFDDEESRQEMRRVLSTQSLIGNSVHNNAGENLGKIHELMIDMATGRIAYAVLSFGGFLGLGDKLFAVPWQALILDVHEHQFILNVNKQQLEHAPGFDKDNWPDMADARFRSTVSAFWMERNMTQQLEHFVCNGCGRSFETRSDLQDHEKECAAMISREKTRTAGGSMPLDE